MMTAVLTPDLATPRVAHSARRAAVVANAFA
jgi:hypothetical protein